MPEFALFGKHFFRQRHQFVLQIPFWVHAVEKARSPCLLPRGQKRILVTLFLPPMKTIVLSVLSLALLFVGRVEAAENVVLRVGHFPNITHAQALVAHNLSRQGKGWFEERLGPGTKIEWFVYNAGPSAMEAVFAHSIDLTYVGPGPALNAYTKSNGAEVRLLAGAANGGAALVVQPDQNLKAPADFRGKKIATPQLGNTQDIACRAWLMGGGLKITQLGGDAQVLPTQNPDQLALFQQKRVDAVWTIEPWVSRLERESGGKILVEERDVATTILVSSVKYLAEKRELAKKFVQAHAELTDWMMKPRRSSRPSCARKPRARWRPT
jgi:NitT/TauT family transport system substrate-binding protein